MLKPLVHTARGKLRVLGYTSGSGNTFWKVLELQKEMEASAEGCPFEVVGIFTDNPASAAVRFAEEAGVPCRSIDIKKYYEAHGKPLKDRELRAQYDAEAMELIEPFQADMILLAGYVWATTAVLLQRYLVVNVHPADLAVADESGHRLLAGANGIKAAFQHGMDYLRSSAHIATSELDAGPLLLRSPRVPVDYTLHEDEEARFRHYLKLVNAQSRLVGARVVLELALGHYSVDETGLLHHRNRPSPGGLLLENWQERIPRFQRSLAALLAPKSVVVMGASARPGIGQAIVQNLKDMHYTGAIYVVNRKGEAVLGCPGFTSLAQIPEAPELGILSLPAAGVLEMAEACGQKGVLALVCVTAGFRELGGEGLVREEALLDIVDRYNMRLLGPNCMGLANTSPLVNFSATILSHTPPPGQVAFLTQSGALGASLIDFATELDLGFSVVASLGNMADINPCDLLPALQDDENTHVICLYLESLPEPFRFEQVMRRVTKPVVMVKAGRSAEGAAAASSHTGSLAANDRVMDAFLEQCGVMRVETLEDAFLLASTLCKMPRFAGSRVGILSNAGGLGTLTTDALVARRFTLPQLSEAAQEELALRLLPEASTANPLDLVASAPPEHYVAAAQAMLASGLYDVLIVNCVPPATVDTGEVAAALADTLKASGLPVFACFFGPSLGEAGRKQMKRAGIPTFSFPEKMVQIMAYMRQSPPCEEPACATVPLKARRQAAALLAEAPTGKYLPGETAFSLLHLYGIPVETPVLWRLGQALPEGLAYPLVAKIDHPGILHKSDEGGVRLNIQSEEAVQSLLEEWKTAFPGLRGLHLQRQVKGAPEMIVGASFDPALGHCILTGLGGTLVELLEDITFGHVPLGPTRPARMLSALRCAPLLTGYRGSQPTNLAQLREILMRLNQLLLDFPDIQEMDINPLLYQPSCDSWVGVDVRVRMR